MFDIQLFADTYTESNVLQTKFIFADDDNRTINVPNPRDDVSANDIQSLSDFIMSSNLIIGDKASADFAGIESAVIIKTTRVKVDIGSNT